VARLVGAVVEGGVGVGVQIVAMLQETYKVF
jgi:hypothetical protein